MVFALACGRTAKAEVKLPGVFGSHMVLQRQKPVIIWGWANAGEAVTVTLGTHRGQTTANPSGEWRVALPAMEAGGPLTLTVTGLNSITLEDVMIGEVWLCSGQSNMEMGVGISLNAAAEIKAANHPGIRLLVVPKTPLPIPQRDFQAQWNVCSPSTLGQGGWGGFSASAYYFGRELHKELNVPVGLIQAAWGGTIIEAWMPAEGFGMLPSLKALEGRVQLANPSSPAHKEGLSQFLDATETWVTAARQAMKETAEVPAMPPLPQDLFFKRDPNTPTALFNGMIAPLVPFGIRGAIWYQGESNRFDGEIYTDKMQALLGSWRKLWGEGDFPFLYVQIAPFQYGDEPSDILPRFWQAQTAALSIPNTGMAVTTDIGMLNDIHPINKQDVGRRLALLALANTYGKSGIVFSGPTFQSLKNEGDKLRLIFENVGGGLVSRDGKPLNWFEVADAEYGRFVKAEAVIDGANSLLLSAPDAPHPIAVRFAWDKTAEPNLSNKEGLPARPFRAGEVPKSDALPKVPEAKDFQLVYDLDLAKIGATFSYAADLHQAVGGEIDRIAYLVELADQADNPTYVYVSMDAFTQDLSKIGVPTFASGACFQKNLTGMNIFSNVVGILTGTGLQGGNIEFWPGNYGPNNSAQVPNASSQVFDFGDQLAPGDGYGSMQIHNHEAKQTLFAINNWKATTQGDLGIGNQPQNAADWTHTQNAGKYQSKRLRVLVRLKR